MTKETKVTSDGNEEMVSLNLEGEALKRKRRLEAMRQLKQQKLETHLTNQEAEEQQKLPRPVFRSYKPLDEQLQKSSMPEAKTEKIDQQLTSELDAAKEAPVLDEIDLVNLAPRKPDWDLKRDVAKKLAKLEKRTQRGIALLIRERLMENKQDLATVVSALK